jgi:hypothetical protein
VIGITISGAGTTGSATISPIGPASCVFDGATTAGDYVQISSSTAGNCHDVGATYPTSGQVIGRVLSTNVAGGTYTVTEFSSEIKPASGGTTVAAAPPYIELGSTFYSSTFYAVTKPSSTPTWINSVTPTVTIGTNGDVVLNSSTSTGAFWAETSGTTSVEAEFSCSGAQTTNSSGCAIFAYDSTNSHIWQFGINSTEGTSGGCQLQMNEWNYSGTGNPSFNTATFGSGTLCQSIYHLKISKSSTTLTFAQSLNGGVTFVTITTQGGIGTLADLGYAIFVGSATEPSIMDVLSLVVN